MTTIAGVADRTRQEVAAWLRSDFARLLRAVELLPDDRLRTPVLDEWTPKEVLAHLCGWDLELSRAIEQVLRAERPQYIDRSEDELNIGFTASRRSKSYDQVISELRMNHERLMTRIEQISDASWVRDSGLRWPNRLPLTVGSLFDYTYRDQSHYAGHAEELEAFAREGEEWSAPLVEAINLDGIEELARDRLERKVFDYYAGGAEDERTIAENRAAFGRRFFRPRVLVDVSEVDMTTDLLGTALPFPIILAPTALQGLAHRDGEVATARAAAALGVLMVISTLSTASMEAVADASRRGSRWFQLYPGRERAGTEDLIRRAEASGYGAIVVTADVPILGRRERDLRNAFTLPPGMSFGNFPARSLDTTRDGISAASWFGWTPGPALGWADLEWIRELTALPIVLKGILRADDAKRAADWGAAAIWLSNHGGRQLDGAQAALDALPEIREAVPDVPLILDGGVRRGTDVIKAIALGAAAVAIGRPQLWGLAVDGQQGVRRVLELLRDELAVAMALTGSRSVGEITADLLA